MAILYHVTGTLSYIDQSSWSPLCCRLIEVYSHTHAAICTHDCVAIMVLTLKCTPALRKSSKLATSFATSTKIDAIGTFQTPLQMPCVPKEVLIQGRQGRDSHWHCLLLTTTRVHQLYTFATRTVLGTCTCTIQL